MNEKKSLKKLITVLIVLMLFINFSSTAYAGEFCWPLRYGITTDSMYDRDLGSLSKGYHLGWDFGSTSNEDRFVYAIADGVVKTKAYNLSTGNYIIIEHTLTSDVMLNNIVFENGSVQASANLGNTIKSYYYHLASGTLLVDSGDKVKGGMPIAIMGNTGSSSGPHLHFAIYSGGNKGTLNGSHAKLFAAEGNSIDFDGKPRGFTEDWNCAAPSGVSNLDKDTKVVFSPCYILGRYEVVDLDINDCENTIENAIELYNKCSKTKEYENTNSCKKNANIPSGMYTVVLEYMNGKFDPKPLNEFLATKYAANGKYGMVIGGRLIKVLDTTGTSELQISGEKTSYGKLEDNDFDLLMYDIGSYAGTISAIFIFIGIVGVGIGLILKRRDSKGRNEVASALLTISIAIIIITSAYVLIDFADSLIG